MKDELGDRIKTQYEVRTKTFLPRRTYTIIRLDGVAFHTFTKGLERPYDAGLIADMDATAKFLCEKIQGAKFAFVQSDEISILLTDFEKNETDSWFDGEVQKIVSVSASLASARFNQLRLMRASNQTEDGKWINDYIENMKLAAFDSRVYTIPDPIEVANYFLWRQKDCTRNSISMGAQALYSHAELEGKSSSDKQEMMFQKGVNWDKYPTRFKRGGFITKVQEDFVRSEMIGIIPVSQMDFEDGVNRDEQIAKLKADGKVFTRNIWSCVGPPIFSADQEFLYGKIPVIASEVMSLDEMLKSTSKTCEESADAENHLS